MSDDTMRAALRSGIWSLIEWAFGEGQHGSNWGDYTGAAASERMEKFLSATLAAHPPDAPSEPGPTPFDDHVVVADALHKMGWESPCDAQWENLRDWCESMKAQWRAARPASPSPAAAIPSLSVASATVDTAPLPAPAAGEVLLREIRDCPHCDFCQTHFEAVSKASAPATPALCERIARELCAIRFGMHIDVEELWERQLEEHKDQYRLEADRILALHPGDAALREKREAIVEGWLGGKWREMQSADSKEVRQLLSFAREVDVALAGPVPPKGERRE